MLDTKNEYNENYNYYDVYAPIINVVNYLEKNTKNLKIDDPKRMKQHQSCILTGTPSDLLFPLWLTLRQAMYRASTRSKTQWEDWWKYEKRIQISLKNSSKFLNYLKQKPENFFPPSSELTLLISQYCSRALTRANVILLPDDENFKKLLYITRKSDPFFDYMPHVLDFLMSEESSLDLNKVRAWIKEEELRSFFDGGKISRELIRKDIAGTDSVYKHRPREINVPLLLENYIEILDEREQLLKRKS